VMLPLLGFAVVDDNIEYDFWDFSVKFPIEKIYNKNLSPDLSDSFVLERLVDNLADKRNIESDTD
jgi:hypothetical protein